MSVTNESDALHSLDQLTRDCQSGKITIVGSGPTGQEFQPDGSMVWSVDGSFVRIPADLIFAMQDLKGPFWRAHRQKEQWLNFFRETEIPVVSSFPHSGFPSLVPFPLEQALAKYAIPYFVDDLSYALAFAGLCEVSSVRLIGCDYYADDRRQQRSCIEFWIGVLMASNIDVEIHPDSSLLAFPFLDGVQRCVPGYAGYQPDRMGVSPENLAMKFPFRQEESLPDYSAMVAR